MSLRPIQAAKNQHISVVLVLDISGSMKKNDPNKVSWDAARMFIDLLSEGDEAAVVTYSSVVHRNTGLLTISSAERNEKEKLKSVLSGDYKGGTQTLVAMEAARQLLAKAKPAGENRTHAILLLTDGQDEIFEQFQKNPKVPEQRYRDFCDKARSQQIRVFPLGMGNEVEKFVPNLKLLTDEEVLVIRDTSELPARFAFIYGQIYDSIVRPLKQEGTHYVFERHELAIETALLASGEFDPKLEYTITTPDQQTLKSTDLKGRGFAAEAKNYRILKLSDNNPRGLYALALTQKPENALVVQIPDLRLKVNWGPFNPSEKKVTVLSAQLMTKSGTEVYADKNFYRNARLQLVIQASGRTTRTPLYDDGSHGDAQAGDYRFAGFEYLAGFGKFIYYVELDHELFRRRSLAMSVSFDEKIRLEQNPYAGKNLTILRGETLSIPVVLSEKSEIGERPEYLTVEFEPTSGPDWGKLENRTPVLEFVRQAPKAEILLASHMGKIFDFGYSAIPVGHYTGRIRLHSETGEAAVFPLEFDVEENPALFWHGLLFWLGLAFILYILLGTFFSKKFPRFLYLVNKPSGTDRISRRDMQELFSTIVPFGSSRKRIGQLGEIRAVDRSGNTLEWRPQVDGSKKITPTLFSLKGRVAQIYNSQYSYLLAAGKKYKKAEVRKRSLSGKFRLSHDPGQSSAQFSTVPE
ncbi:MAG: VWA domain-containing protein [Turneriella sp.]|nr:VWA domain-containing protein [Turneriella sp.]